MTIKYDKVADAVYVKMTDTVIANSTKIDDTTIVDKDADGNIVGLEILDASSRQGLTATLERNVPTGIPISIINSTPVAA
jgi:uncharacterized protein YuzE